MDARPGGVAAHRSTEIPDSHRDLLDVSVATLATIDPQGRPQLTEAGSSPRTAR